MKKEDVIWFIIVEFVAASITWSIFWAVVWINALLYNDGFFVADVNSLGEGWPEVILFIVVTIMGLYVLVGLFRGDIKYER